jgi:hypothetical protein
MPSADFDLERGVWIKECSNPECPVGVYVGVKDQAASDEMFAKNFGPMTNTLDGLHVCCKSCNSDSANGRSFIDRDALLAKQNGLCAICGRGVTFRYRSDANVDHCHNTHITRGVLCSYCNHLMAAVDNDLWLVGAITYIDAYRFGMTRGFYVPKIVERKSITQNPYRWSDAHKAYVKTCPQCRRTIVGTADEETSQAVFGEYFNRARTRDRYRSQCKDCDSGIQYRREFVGRHALLAEQGGCCVLCERALSLKQAKMSNVDFDRDTGRVRGVVCQACQRWVRGIENQGWLKAALAYRDHYRKLHRRQMAA